MTNDRNAKSDVSSEGVKLYFINPHSQIGFDMIRSMILVDIVGRIARLEMTFAGTKVQFAKGVNR